MTKAGREFQFEGMGDGGAPNPYLQVLSKKHIGTLVAPQLVKCLLPSMHEALNCMKTGMKVAPTVLASTWAVDAGGSKPRTFLTTKGI